MIRAKERFHVTMLLMALGFYKDKLGSAGPAAIDALRSFQRTRGLPKTGRPDPQTLLLLRQAGGPILDYFGFEDVKHPVTGSRLAIPANLLAEWTRTQRGLFFDSRKGKLTIDFAFVSRNQSTFEALYARLSRNTTNRKIFYKTIETDFFVITGLEKRHPFVTRYQSNMDGSIGFTLVADPAKIRYFDRLAILVGALFQAGPAAPDITGGKKPGNGSQKPPSKKGGIRSGSGFFVSASGVGITNYHVIRGCSVAKITGYGETEIAATDKTNDLAVVRLKGSKTTKPVEIRRKPPRLGESVFALGFPLAGALDNGLNFTSGVVSSLAGVNNDSRILQFSAPIQPGNSGGPLLDASGALIGVVQAKLNDIAALKAVGAVPQNVNFAIKSEILLSFLNANKIEAVLAKEARSGRPAAEVAETGGEATFQVQCRPPEAAPGK